jgi:molybdopterin synthase catalytic subunit
MNRDKAKYKYFVDGPISSEIISGLISGNQYNHKLGAQSMFLGQVRADKHGESIVHCIHYSAYTEMAEKEIEKIKETAANQFGLSNINILHSIGEVKCGGISVFVLISSVHREDCFDSLKYIVNEIKTKVPIWKKEIYNDGSYKWIE